MPLYPYRCTQCGHHFEKIQRFSDKPLKQCPKCGGALERQLTAPGLKFVGTGWYANDYGLHVAPGVSSDSSEKKPESKPPDGKSTSPDSTTPAPTTTSSTS